MMTREMNAVVTHGPPTVPSMKPGVKLRKAIIELLETEKTYVKVCTIRLVNATVLQSHTDWLFNGTFNRLNSFNRTETLWLLTRIKEANLKQKHEWLQVYDILFRI